MEGDGCRWYNVGNCCPIEDSSVGVPKWGIPGYVAGYPVNPMDTSGFDDAVYDIM
jgi:hypothetical protein